MAEQVDEGDLDELYQKIVGQVASDPALDSGVAGAQAVLALIAQLREHGSLALDSVDVVDDDTARVKDTIRAEQAYREYYEDENGAWPSTIGRFKVERPLGRGGFGTVFLARDPNLGRDVALKIPHLERVTTPELKSRFIREGRAVASLAHPNIVPVYESGQVGSICYLASQFVDGQTLAQWQGKEEQVPVKVAAEIVIALAEAMAHAHQRGVLHRDIKPANVLIKDAAVEGNDQANASELRYSLSNSFADRILIMDFGLAKILDESDWHTRTGSIVGTPAFMAPEQARQGPATASSDIYSLGAVLYQLLTGKPPFVKSGLLETLAAVASDPPKAPSKLNGLVDADLDAICLKCLEKDPAARFADAFQLKSDLSNWLAGGPISARRPSVVERSVRWIKFNRTVATAAAIVFSVLVSAAAVSGYFGYRSAIDRRSAIAASNQSLASETLALKQTRRISQAIQKLFTTIAAEKLIQKPEFAPLRRELYESANGFLAELSVEQPDDHELLREHFNSLIWAARVYLELGFVSESLAVLEDAESILKNFESGVVSGLLSATLKSTKARAMAATGETKAGLALSLEAVDACEKFHQDHPDDDVHTQVYLVELSKACRAAIGMGDFLTAEQLSSRQRKLLEEIHQCGPLDWPADYQTATSLCVLSRIAENKIQYQVAEMFATRAAQIMRQLLDEDVVDHSGVAIDRSDLADVLQCLGMIKSNQGRIEEATKFFREAIASLKHPSLEYSLAARGTIVAIEFDLAITAEKNKDLELAARHAEACLEMARIYEEQSGETDMQHIEFRCLGLLHSVLSQSNQTVAAEAKLKESLELGKKLYNRDPDNFSLRTNYVEMLGHGAFFYLHDRRDDEKAKHYAELALQLGKQSYSEGGHKPAFDQYCYALTCRAGVAARMGEPELELACLKRYLELVGNEKGEGICLRLICVYCDVGQFEIAIEHMADLLDRTMDSRQKFRLSLAIAQAVQALASKPETEAYSETMSNAAIALLQELQVADEQIYERSLGELLTDKNFDSIRDKLGFPNE